MAIDLRQSSCGILQAPGGDPHACQAGGGNRDAIGGAGAHIACDRRLEQGLGRGKVAVAVQHIGQDHLGAVAHAAAIFRNVGQGSGIDRLWPGARR